MSSTPTDHLPSILQQLARLQDAPGRARATLEQAVLAHPGDPRLLVLLGANLIHGKELDRAEAAYIAALNLAPQFALARFQLGLLQLTSGRPAAAQATWALLEQLDEEHPLRLFKSGLELAVHARFEEARAAVLAGMARNTDNPPLNKDMQLFLDRLASVAGPPQPEGPGAAPAEGGGAAFLISNYGRGT